MRPGGVRLGLVWFGEVGRGRARWDGAWQGQVGYGVVSLGKVRHGEAW